MFVVLSALFYWLLRLSFSASDLLGCAGNKQCRQSALLLVALKPLSVKDVSRSICFLLFLTVFPAVCIDHFRTQKPGVSSGRLVAAQDEKLSDKDRNTFKGLTRKNYVDQVCRCLFIRSVVPLVDPDLLCCAVQAKWYLNGESC